MKYLLLLILLISCNTDEDMNIMTANLPSGLGGGLNPPDTSIPSGVASVSIQRDRVFAAYNPSNPNYQAYLRTSMKELADGTWVCIYANSAGHGDTRYSQLMIQFSDDYGETWSGENKYLDGNSVSGFPLYPPTARPSLDAEGAGEPWLMVMPNGDLICTMWKVDYGSSYGGTYQSRSIDGGKTWSTPTYIDFVGIGNDDDIFMTDDDFVKDGVVYSAARLHVNSSESTPESLLMKSSDNGVTWTYVSHISHYNVNPTLEVGIEYVGNDTIVAHGRGLSGGCTSGRLMISTDMGLTWNDSTPTNIQILSRQRIKTRSHVKRTDNWWQDPVVISHGFSVPAGAGCYPRHAGIWVSKDFGATWGAFLEVRPSIYDAGYGDFLWNPIKEEYVTITYGGISYSKVELFQTNWKLTWS